MEISTENIKRTKSVKLILIEGKKLFWKYGIQRVTVDEICKEAGVSKMTFYRTFDNKYELAKIILIELANDSYVIFSELFSREDPFPEIIKEFLEVKRAQAKAVSMEFVKDLYEVNDFTSSLRALLEDSQQKMMAIVFKSFDKAREEGWIHEHMSTPFIMYIFDKIGNMTEDEHLLSLFSSSEELVVTLTNFLFHGILKTQNAADE